MRSLSVVETPALTNKKINKTMKKILILLSVILLCTSNILSQQMPRIAVFVVVNENDDDDMRTTKRILGTRLVESIARSDLFTAVERSDVFFNEIMRAQAFQGGGQVRDDQIVERARISGERYIIIADITRFRGEEFVEARILDVESGNIIGVPASSDVTIRRMSDLITISDEVSNRLIRQTPQYRNRLRTIDDQRRREEEETARLAREAEQRRRQDSVARREQLQHNQFCNEDIPGWGNSLGAISFASSRMWQVGNQTWSDAVTATACQKTTFNGGINGDFSSDCRSNPNQRGDFFSWCAVRRFANQLCPPPWRVPTQQDFISLDISLGNIGNIRNPGREFVTNNYVNRWGGVIGGRASSPANTGSWGTYWSQSERGADSGFALSFSDRQGFVNIAGWGYKNDGIMLRCVR